MEALRSFERSGNRLPNDVASFSVRTGPRLCHCKNLKTLMRSYIYWALSAGAIHCHRMPAIIAYSSAVRPSESLSLLIANSHSPLSTVFWGHLLNLHLPQILLHVFQPSQSSPSSFRFTLKYFLDCPSLIQSYYMSNPFQFFFIIFATMSRSSYSSLNSWHSYSPHSLLYHRS
jgi:hypothetical protein